MNWLLIVGLVMIGGGAALVANRVRRPTESLRHTAYAAVGVICLGFALIAETLLPDGPLNIATTLVFVAAAAASMIGEIRANLTERNARALREHR